MKKYILIAFALLLCLPVLAQRSSVPNFSVEELPAELLNYLNGNAPDSDKQKEKIGRAHV